jgi:hypothetical protein
VNAGCNEVEGQNGEAFQQPFHERLALRSPHSGRRPMNAVQQFRSRNGGHGNVVVAVRRHLVEVKRAAFRGD